MQRIVDVYLDFIPHFNSYIFYDNFNECFYASTDEPAYDCSDGIDCVVYHRCCPEFRRLNAAERRAESRAVIRQLKDYLAKKK